MNTKQAQSIFALVGALCLGLGIYMILNPTTSVSVISSASSSEAKTATSNPLDVSADYGIVKETIFHKKKLIAFSTPAEFFKHSGKTSFKGLIFDRMETLPTGLHFVDGRPLSSADYRRARGGK